MPANGYEYDINMSLNMTANTEEAKAKLKELQVTLDNLTSKSLKSNGDNFLTKDIIKATNAASQLKTQLESATNVKTGQLDIGKLSQSLKASGMTLEDYRKQFNKLGPEGTAAFNNIASSISNAAMPMKQTGRLLNGLMTNLKKVAAWQISSSILHGFMSSINQAYQYVQDLNESLNRIQIVTGQNTQEMAKFAEQANKSAKALSSTTVDYTDAALIFYQQGLKGKDVTDRTDTVIKMANVTKESAEDVSSQMTAIWNNFYDGSESLEHYADVITNLGAHTASSSKEIAEGLEKFAAVGDTVGLSYDYATTALATVVAQTRQSADTVGTSFKTIFSRLEGLQLGKTLEDGTDLNKYSAALQKVGVDIKTSSGELKNMDTILDDLGERWQNLERDQKMALAQTVGGVRQYTQLIALMDNWGTFKENLGYAQTADGTLQQQQDIYAQSWEGASKRVQAAAEEMYSALLDDKFFVGLTNLTGDIINGFTAIIKSMGGLPQLLLTIGPLLTTYFGPQLANSLDRAAYNAKLMFENLKVNLGLMKQEETEMGQFRKSAFAVQDQQAIYATQGKDPYSATQVKLHMEERNQLERDFYDIKDKITELEQKQLQEQLDQNKELQEELKTTEQIAAEKSKEFYSSIAQVAKGENSNAIRSAANKQQEAEANAQLFKRLGMYHDVKEDEDKIKPYSELIKSVRLLNDEVEKSEGEFEAAYGIQGVEAIKQLQQKIDETEASIQKLNEQENNLNLDKFNSQFQNKNGQYNIKDINDFFGFKKDIQISEEDLTRLANDPINLIKERIKKQIEELKSEISPEINKIYGDFAKQANNSSKDLKEKIKNNYNDRKEEIVKKNFVSENGKSFQTEDAAKQLSKLTGQDVETLRKQLSKAFDTISSETKDTNEQMNRMRMIMRGIASENMESKVNQDFEAISNSAKNYADQLVEVTINGQKVTMSVEEMKKHLEELNNKPLTFGQTISGLATITMSVTSLINGFKNLAEVWSSDASVGEKLFSTFTTLGSVMMSMSMLLTDQNKKVLESIGLKIMHTTVEEQLTSATAKAIIAKRLKAGADEAEAIAATKAAIANQALYTSLIWITVAIVALIAIIWLVTSAFEAWKQSTPEGKLKSAQETSAALGEELTRTKQAAEELKQSIESYDNAVKKLDECAKGTQEWKEALNEANEEALKLANLDPVNIKLERDEETGLLTISEKSKEAATNAKNLDVNRITYAKHQSDQRVQNLQNQISIKELGKDISLFPISKIDTELGLDYTQGEVSFIEQALFPTSGLRQQTLDSKNNAISKIVENLSDNLDKLESFDAFKQFANNLGVSNDSLIKSLYDNKTELIKLTNSVDANNKLREQENAEDVRKVVEAANSKDYKAATNKNDIDQLISQQMKQAAKPQEEAAQEYMDMYNNPFTGWALKSSAAAQLYSSGIITQYAKLKGYSNNIGQDQYKFENDQIIFTIDGQEIKTSLSTIFAEITANTAQEAGKIAVQTYSEIANQMASATGGKGAFSYIANQKFDNLTQKQISGLQNAFKGNNITAKNIAEQFNITEDQLNTLLEAQDLTFEELVNNIKKNAPKAQQEIENNLKDFGILKSSITEKVTLQQSKDIQKALTTVNTDEARADLQQAYNKILSGLNQKDFNKALSELNKIDWGSSNAIDQAKQKMQELGINIQYTDKDWKNLKKQIAESNGNLSIDKYEKLKNVLSAIDKTASDLNIGDEISKTDYENLTKYNSELEKYFSITSKGKYKVIDDSFKNDVDFLNQASKELREYDKLYNDIIKDRSKKITRYDSDEEVDINDYIIEKGIDSKALFSNSEKAQLQRTKLWEKINDKDSSFKKIKEKILNEINLTENDIDPNSDSGKRFFSAYAKFLDKGAKDGFNTSSIIENLKKGITNLADLNEARTSNKDFTKGDYSQTLNRLMTDTSEKFNLGSSAVKDYSENLQKAGKTSNRVSKDLIDNADAAKQVALTNTNMNSGLTSLRKNFKDNASILKKGKVEALGYSKALETLRQDVSTILNLDTKALSNNFFQSTTNLQLMGKAIKGDINAIKQLRKEAAKDILINMILSKKSKKVKKQVLKLQLELQALLDKQNLQIGQNVSVHNAFFDKLKEMAKAAKMTVDEISSYAISLGYIANFGKNKKGKQELKSLTYQGSIADTLAYENTAAGIKEKENKKKSSNKDKTKNKEETKRLVDEKERYHQITKQIDTLNKSMELLNKQKDHLYGKAKLKAMDKEIASQKKLIKLEAKKQKEAQKYAAQDRERLKKYGAKFNKNGSLSNYDSLMAQEVKKYNDAIRKYNASAQTKADKNALKAAKSRYKYFTEDLKNYEEALATSQDQAIKVAEAKAQLLSKRLEKIDYKLQIKVDINDRKLKRLETALSLLKDIPFSQARQISLLDDQVVLAKSTSAATRNAARNAVRADLKTQGKTISDKKLNKLLDGQLSDKQIVKLGLSSDTIEALKKHSDSLAEENNAIRESINAGIEAYQGFWDEGRAVFDEFNQSLEHYGKMLKSYNNIVELLGRRVSSQLSGRAIANNYLAQADAANAQIKVNQDKLNFSRQNSNDLDKQIKAAKDIYKKRVKDSGKKSEAALTAEKALEDLKKQRKDLDAEIQSEEEALATSWENALTTINEGFEKSVKAISQYAQEELIKKLSNGANQVYNSWSEVAKAMTRQKELTDLTFKDYKQIYETSKLMRQINQSLDKTDNLKAQKEYNKLLEEVRYYQDKSHEMSKYDLEYLQKKYALTQAQIALEEARDAKHQVRLTRDSEGNYGYLYTADSSKVDSAQQSYEDKLYELQEFMDKSQEELSQSYVTAYQKMYEEIEALRLSDFKNAEEYQKKKQEIIDHYTQMGNAYLGDLKDITDRGEIINNDYSTNLADTYKETWLGEVFPAADDFSELLRINSETIDSYSIQLQNNFQDFETKVDKACKNAGTNIKNFGKKYNKETENIKEDTEKVINSSDDMKEQLNKDYKSLKAQMENWRKKVLNEGTKIINKNEKIVESVNEIIEAYNRLAKKKEENNNNKNRKNNTNNNNNNNNNSGGSGDSGTKTTNNQNSNATTSDNSNGGGYVFATKKNDYVFPPLNDSYLYESKDEKSFIKSTHTNDAKALKNVGIIGSNLSILTKNGQKIYRIKFQGKTYYTPASNLKEDFLKNNWYKLQSYNTGGYTGEWGANGKLATLHEKELVLNQSDTKNMLTIVDIVRKLVNDLNNFSAFGGALHSASFQTQKETLEQKVEIKAEFPNVQDHNEIEQAFENLVNKAAQYANLK